MYISENVSDNYFELYFGAKSKQLLCMIYSCLPIHNTVSCIFLYSEPFDYTGFGNDCNIKFQYVLLIHAVIGSMYIVLKLPLKPLLS